MRTLQPRHASGTLFGLLLASMYYSPLAQACATCGCTLGTDAATGYSTVSGWRLSLDDTYINQSQLRHGSGRATVEQVINQPSDPDMAGGEIEKGTVNRYLTLGVAYRFNADWGVSLAAPWVWREHSTYGMQMQPYAPSMTAFDQVSTARVVGLGDIKLIGDYQGFLPMHNLGVQFGVKLPTGRYGGQVEDGRVVGHPVSFRSGPMRGEALDASLQAGTGSTDLIVGAYYYQPVSQNFDAFVSGQFQAAMAHRLDDYRPGNQTSLSVGLRYEAHANWVPQLQLNWQRKAADQGALADAPNSAGTVAYLSPGISASLSRTVQAYVFVQLPVYRHLDGYQLFPGWTGTLGLSVQL